VPPHFRTGDGLRATSPDNAVPYLVPVPVAVWNGGCAFGSLDSEALSSTAEVVEERPMVRVGLNRTVLGKPVALRPVLVTEEDGDSGGDG
jgi:hypothetical protein